MANARSPRDVCSTTIGTSGLIGRAVYKSDPPGLRGARSFGSGRPEAGLLGLSPVLLRRPELLAGGGLLYGYRLRRFGDHVRGLAEAKLLAQQRVASESTEALEQLFGRLVSIARAERREQLLLGDIDLLGVGDGRQGRFAPQRPLRIGLEVGDQLLAVLAL